MWSSLIMFRLYKLYHSTIYPFNVPKKKEKKTENLDNKTRNQIIFVKRNENDKFTRKWLMLDVKKEKKGIF